MRKIRKFSVNENGFLLSPEEMRRINGGASGECDYGAGCEAEVYNYYPLTGKREFVGKYSGTCNVESGSCGCKTSVGFYTPINTKTSNGCEK